MEWDWEITIRIRHECFAYDKATNSCNALNQLYCRKEECKFFKTANERCYGCVTSKGKTITCKECKDRGLK